MKEFFVYRKVAGQLLPVTEADEHGYVAKAPTGALVRSSRFGEADEFFIKTTLEEVAKAYMPVPAPKKRAPKKKPAKKKVAKKK